MSTALLQELHQEVRRIYIAGSDLAAGDFRLKRMLPQFQQLGERSPVFKRLGEGIQALIEPAAGTSSSVVLQDLGSLLGSILYTQGTTAPAGELSPITNKVVPLTTKASYRKLSAVREALTTTGSGRHEIIIDAWENGVFQDVRVMQLAIRGLDDPYAELADYMAEKVLPSIGPVIVPELIATFRPDGGRSEARKLQIIWEIEGAAHLGLILQSAEEGSDEVRGTAIRLVGKSGQYGERVLEWTKDRRKAIREAAFETLECFEGSLVDDRIYEGLTSKDSDMAMYAARSSGSVELRDRMIELLREQVQRFLTDELDAKKREALSEQMMVVIYALQSKQSDTLIALYEEMMQHVSLRTAPCIGIARMVADYLATYGGEQQMNVLLQLEQEDSPLFLHYAYTIGRRLMTPAQCFETFTGGPHSTAAKKKRIGELMRLIEEEVITSGYENMQVPWKQGSSDDTDMVYVRRCKTVEEMRQDWDPRWAEWAMRHSHLALVVAFAEPGQQAAEQFLREKIEKKPELRSETAELALLGLKRIGIPDLSEVLMTALEQRQNRNMYRLDLHIWEIVLEMPASYKERLEKIRSKFTYYAEDQINYVLQQMEAKLA